MFRRTSWQKVLLITVSCALLCSTFLLLQIAPSSSSAHSEANKVNVWLTTADLQTHLAQQNAVNFSQGIGSAVIQIAVNEKQTDQQIDGFGASLTDGSAWLISHKMSKGQQDALMQALFSPTRGIGLDFLRQPMGASDLTAPSSGEYSYDDMPPGQTDPNLTRFSIQHDEAYIIPLLKQALRINPNLKILATPWSPPGWMKSTDSMEGGTLNADAYAPYAN
jgi:glucosylceramidase